MMNTWGMMCLQSPGSIRRIGNYMAIPLDLQMAWRLFQERRAWKGLHVELWFWWHCRIVPVLDMGWLRDK